MSETIRPSLLSGRWYPDNATDCDQFFSQAPLLQDSAPEQCVAAIVPHAGWVYSGAISYGTMAVLHAQQKDADLVVLFGGHLGPRHSPRLFLDEGWATPFGALNIAKDLAQDIAMGIECDLENGEEFYDDNATEVQMPMIKKLWPAADLLVAGIPPNDRSSELGREIIDLARRRGYKRIVIIGSTDMTHYGPNYNYQPQGRGQVGLEWVKTKNDPLLIEQIEAMNTQKVMWLAKRHQNACCPGAINATIAASRDLGASQAKLTQYKTSFDVLPDGQPTSFVGYAGFLLGR